uniref:G-protein coupled receptors family 1 profile domain-containing protein n=1 Tax=Moschus moschiferus TaxID=68415 RepID=A0A8C6FZB2_MOSMO
MNQTLYCALVLVAMGSSPEVKELGTAHWVPSAMILFTCVGAVVGNGPEVWLLGSQGQRSPFSVYVLHVGMADLLFLLCMASKVILNCFPLGDTGHMALEMVSRGTYFTYTASLSLLTAISMQRCLSVLFPIWYKCHRPQHLSAVVCTLLWALSLLLNTLATFFCSDFWGWDKQQGFTMDLVISIHLMGVFTPLMAGSSLILCVRVQRSSAATHRRPTRLCVTILVCVLVSLVFVLPLGIHWFLIDWLDLPQETKTLFSLFARLSSAMNSSANRKPMIYFLVGSGGHLSLREPLGAVLSRVLQEEPKLEEGETPSTNPTT